MTSFPQRLSDISPEIRESLATPLNEVVPGLYLGNLAAATDYDILKTHKITHVVQVLDEDWEPFASEGIQYHKIRIDDSPDERITQFLDNAFDFIDSALAAGGVVLVHCQMGQSRSGAVMVGWIMRRDGIGYDEALRKVRERRLCVKPNEGFEKQLRMGRGVAGGAY
ncbi:hypothetical protein HDV00_004869 [Rhizophlyctis rosea]|nr:hypothetical protein HDV00_004869 [Rhizophlyctis rosea]